LVILGGIKRIGNTSSRLVPLMIALYVGTGLVILLKNYAVIPEMFGMIFDGAFSGTAAVGGFAGAAVKEALRFGLARGVFSNESGLGTSPIAAAAAKTKHPVEQALVSMTQTFIDTIVVCTFTGLVLLSTGLWSSGADAAALTAQAFGAGLGHATLMGYEVGGMIVSLCLIFFAFSSIVGWYYYGQKGASFIFGEKATQPFKIVYVLLVPIGAILQVKVVWAIADVSLGLMIIPNLIGLLLLSNKIRHLTIDYFRNEVDGMGYQVEPFHDWQNDPARQAEK